MDGKVTLTGASAYLKVVFNVEATKANGDTVEDSVAISTIQTALGEALKAQTVSNWVKGTDNNWYCIASNDAGDVINFNGKSFTIPLAETGNIWQGATIKAGYSVSAIQSSHVELAGEDDAAKAASLKALFDSLKDDNSGLVG